MKQEHNIKLTSILICFLVLILVLVSFAYAIPTFGLNYGTTSNSVEDQTPIFFYNFSSITTDLENGTWTYSILGINSSSYPSLKDPANYSWINLNSTSGIMTIDPRFNNETGRFNLSVQVLNEYTLGESRPFYFIVNTTNDYPNFTDLQNDYNLSQNVPYFGTINASDEENMYPLFMNISFVNCTHASWSDRNNCSLVTLTNRQNISSYFNYTPSRNDVGVYYANVSVRDAGINYPCTTGYCESNYSENRTFYYSQLVVFNVFSNLEINSSDCNNKVFQENVSNSCVINITTKGSNDTLNISSIASLRNYNGNVSNISWFFAEQTTNSDNFTKAIIINVTPGKTEVGNFTINFTVLDFTFNMGLSVNISIYVNRTYNDPPRLETIPDINTSINLSTRINITVYDDDMLIPDKNSTGGGFNETMNFTVRVYNVSNWSQQKNLTNFTLRIVSMPVYGTNTTQAKIEFTLNGSDAGFYTVNITVKDKNNVTDTKLFNLSIINNSAPVWDPLTYTEFVYFQGNNTYLNLSSNATDPNGDRIIFSWTNDTSFASFFINSTTGVIDFNSTDFDVGQHLVTIRASDGYLNTNKIFNFTIYNLNDTPVIERPLQITNGSIDSSSNIIVSEDNNVSLKLWIQDNDLKIPNGQKGYYNETLNVSYSIVGTNINLFNFTKQSGFPNTVMPNKSFYLATFIPRKSDVGIYNITLVVNDTSGLSDTIQFNLTVGSIEHSPTLQNISNMTSAVYRELYFNLSVQDVEDGNSSIDGSNSNFTYSYYFMNGTDFIKNNETIFNTTTGVFNITFNSTQGGKYRINITARDLSGRNSTKNFWLYVYDIPQVIYPDSSYQFNLAENVTYNLTFKVNHSVKDNLTYKFYVQNDSNVDFLKFNISSFGNNSNYTWVFNVSFNDELDGVKNLTLVLYPTNNALENNSDINFTQIWNITIAHMNEPLTFGGLIGGVNRNLSGGSPLKLILSDYFSDADATDPRFSQLVVFQANLIATNNGTINITIQNWVNRTQPTITFSTEHSCSANYTITGFEYNVSNSSQIINSVTSNNFLVELQVDETSLSTPQPSSGSSSSPVIITEPIAFKLIVPGAVSAFAYEKITIPIGLLNKGQKSFKSVNLTTVGYKDGNISSVVKVFLNRTFYEELKAGETQNNTLTVYINTNKTSNYEIVVNATSLSPEYTDWARIFINLQKINESELRKYLVFTEEYLVQNPQCLELLELVNEAKKAYELGNFADARIKAESAINACKDYVAQPSLPKSTTEKAQQVDKYLIYATLLSIFLGISYYFLKRKRITNT